MEWGGGGGGNGLGSAVARELSDRQYESHVKGRGPGRGVGQDHVCAIFADSAL